MVGSEGWVKRDWLLLFLHVKPPSLLESSHTSGYQSHTWESSGPHESTQLRMWRKGRLWGPSSCVWLESWHWVQGRRRVSGGESGCLPLRFSHFSRGPGFGNPLDIEQLSEIRSPSLRHKPGHVFHTFANLNE